MDLSEHYRSWHREDAERMLFGFAMSKVELVEIEDLLDNMLMFARLSMIDRERFAAVVAVVGECRPDAISELAIRFARGDDDQGVN